MADRKQLAIRFKAGVLEQGTAPLDSGHRPRLTPGWSRVDGETVGDERQIGSGRQLGHHLVASVGADRHDRLGVDLVRQLRDGFGPGVGPVVAEQVVFGQVYDLGSVGRGIGGQRFGIGTDQDSMQGLVHLGRQISSCGQGLKRRLGQPAPVVFENNQ